jgi:hypothetical protein
MIKRKTLVEKTVSENGFHLLLKMFELAGMPLTDKKHLETVPTIGFLRLRNREKSFVFLDVSEPKHNRRYIDLCLVTIENDRNTIKRFRVIEF